MLSRRYATFYPLCSRLLTVEFSTTTTTGTGLLGFRELKTQADIKYFVDDSISNCNQLRNILHKVPDICHKNPQDALLIIDAISNELCKVLDSMEFIRNAHESHEYQEQAQKAFEKMSIYMQSLNSDTIIYKRLQEIVILIDQLKLTPEEKKFAVDMHDEFITEGIQFHDVNNKLYDPQVIGEISRMKTMIMQLESQYMQNMTNSDLNVTRGRFLLGPFSSEEEGNREYILLYSYMKSIGIEQVYNGMEVPHGYIMCPNGSQGGNCRQLLISMMFSVSSQELRKRLWYELIQCPSANKVLFAELIATRYELAKVLGFDSHSNRFRHTKLLKSQDEVYTFLQDFSNIIRKDAEVELSTLKSLNSDLDEMKPWDVDKLINNARKTYGRVNGTTTMNTGQSALEKISKYFALGKCISSLKMLCHELFDINMIQLTMTNDEKWVSNGQIFKYELIHNACNESLGYIYFDLFQRPNKFNNNAHFTIQCGCTNNSSKRLIHKYPIQHRNTLTDWFKFKSKPTMNTDPNPTASTSQLPVVVLTSNISGGDCTELSYDQLENLYHEFGHALHSLLSRTTFQHLSGTRGSVDFIEIPSHLFEYFSRSKEVLREWSTHGNECIPLDLIDEAQAERSLFKNLELQSQILYSVSDQYLHGNDIGKLLDKHRNHDSVMVTDTDELYNDLLRNICQLQSEYTVLPLDKNCVGDMSGLSQPHPSMYPLAHSHYINYAGGYYTYLYAKLWSAQIWCNLFDKNPLSRKSGVYLWENLLKHGAAKDPLTMLESIGKGDGKSIPLASKYYVQNR